MKKVLGLVGPIGSGKGVVAEVLKQGGYSYYSLSDRVREEARSRGLEIKRQVLQDLGDKLRRTFGKDILARRTYELVKSDPSDKIVVDSLRNPSEVEFIKEKLNAKIIGVISPFEKRFELVMMRARESDPKTLEEFKKIDSRDLGVGQEHHGQQVTTCLSMADVTIENTGSLEDLKRKSLELLK